jgi:membrane protease YdiL (CAAX protease family)
MINSILLGSADDPAAEKKRRFIIVLSPLAVILLGQVAARMLGPLIGVWSWVPLTTGYWIGILLLVAWGGGKEATSRWLQRSGGAWYWPLLAVSIGVIPTLPMLFPDTWRIFLRTEVWLPTIFFVILNPFAEEAYWRGLLLDAMSDRPRWLRILYSSILFMVNHMWMSVMAIGARNPVASAFQFIFGVIMSVAYLKTQSLRWPLAGHFLANLLTPTVAVFLNLYIPGAPG